MKQFLSKHARRLIVWILLVCLSVGLYGIPVFAKDPPSKGPPHQSFGVGSSGSDSSASTATADQPWGDHNKERDSASFSDKLIGDMVAGITYALDKMGFTPIDKLVFGEDRASVALFATNDKGESEFESVATIYWYIVVLAWVALVAVVALKGLKIARGKSNPKTRASITEISIDFIVGIALMGFSWFIVSYLTEWNISLCQLMLPDQINFEPADTGDYLMTQFIHLVLIVMSIFINIMYVLRRFLLIGAVVMGPFVGLAYAAGNKQAFSIWLKETITNAFLPLSHAMVLSLYFRLYAWGKTNQVGLMAKWYVPFVCLFFIFPISAYFRRLFSSYVGGQMGVDAESESKNAFTSAMGLGGAVALGGALLAKKVTGFGKNGGAKGNLGKGGSSESGVKTAHAGAMQRSSAPNSIKTGIGQTGSYQGNIQNSIGKGKEKGSTIGSVVGRVAGGAAGFVIDTGVMASTGRDMKFRHSLGNAGGTVGGVVGGAVGAVGGAVEGGAAQVTSSARRFPANGPQRSAGWTPAFGGSRGGGNGGAASNVVPFRPNGASYRTTNSDRGGGAKGNRPPSKGLERKSTLKQR